MFFNIKKISIFLILCLFNMNSAFAAVTENTTEEQVQYTQEEEKIRQAEIEEQKILKEKYLDENGLVDTSQYIPVIMYHHFVDKSVVKGNSTTMNIIDFERHMKVLKELGYTPIFLDELYDIIVTKEIEKGLDKKYIVITMDDGYRSNFELAYPILKKYNMKANISVIVGQMYHNYVVTGIPKVCWRDMNEMQESELVRIYSHSYSHKMMAAMTPSEIKNEVLKAEGKLDECLEFRGKRIFTYPNGSYSYRSKVLVRSYGYDLQISTDYGVVTKDTSILNIPRIYVASGTTEKELIESINKAAMSSFNIKTE